MSTIDVTMNVFARVLVLLLPIALLAGLIVLQIFLSRAKSKILGLILPISTFVISLLVVAGMLLLMIGPIDGAVVASVLLLIFFPMNIPTLIFLLIYFLSRKKLNDDNNQEIKKMTIQDLE